MNQLDAATFNKATSIKDDAGDYIVLADYPEGIWLTPTSFRYRLGGQYHSLEEAIEGFMNSVSDNVVIVKLVRVKATELE